MKSVSYLFLIFFAFVASFGGLTGVFAQDDGFDDDQTMDGDDGVTQEQEIAAPKPHLVVLQSVDVARPSVGAPMRVTYVVANKGDADAEDVVVESVWDESAFEISEGSPKAERNALKAGEKFEHTFVVVPQKLMVLEGQAAQASVSYSNAEDGEPLVGRGSGLFNPAAGFQRDGGVLGMSVEIISPFTLAKEVFAQSATTKIHVAVVAVVFSGLPLLAWILA